MIKNIEDAIFYAINKDTKNDSIKFIDVQNHYNFTNMLDSFYKVVSNSLSAKIEIEDITVICVTYENFRIAKDKGYKAYYIYDLLDFTDNYYYFLRKIPNGQFYILESADNITSDVIERLKKTLPKMAKLFVFHDSVIPRRYSGEDDIKFINSLTSYNVENLQGNKSYHSTPINSLVNKLRSKKTTLKEILEKPIMNSSNKVEFIHSNKFKLSDVDITEPIITTHLNLIKDLNIKIRQYLGLVDVLDEYKPNVNEYIVSHGFSCCNVDGKEVCLPVGYRLKVKDIKTSVNKDNNYYIVYFDYEYPTGEISEANIKISKSYIEYLVDGKTDLTHDPNSYNYFFGYVISAYHSINNRYDKASIIYDYTLSMDRRDLYTCLVPVVDEVRLFFTLDKNLEIEE